MYVSNLIYEVTRRCNATCEHCLRGDAEALDISSEVINASLKGITSISSLVFTGGEPSLAVPQIKKIISAIKKRKIDVSGFYCVTNGKVPSLSLAYALMSLYAYCGDNEVSSFCISGDQYHTNCIGDTKEARRIYSSLSFFHDNERREDINSLLDEGRANENGIGGKPVIVSDLDIERDDEGNIEQIDGDLYINAKGDVLTCCDLSFERQEEEKRGNVLESPISQIFK